MKTTKQLVMIVCLMILVGIPLRSHAADPTITMTIVGDQTCSPPGSGTAQGTLVIVDPGAGKTFVCGAYTFRAYDTTKAARIESLGNSINDTLALWNTKISRSGTPPDLHITFSGANFTDPPTSGSPVSVMYQVSAAGFFKRDTTSSLAVDSHIYTRGYVQTPPGNTNQFMLGSNPPSSTGIELDWVVCGTGGCSNYIPSTYNTSTTFTTLDANRVLQGEFWVKLSGNSDTLTLTSLTVVNTTGGGQQCDPEKDENCPPQCPQKECVPCLTKKQMHFFCNVFGLFCRTTCTLP